MKKLSKKYAAALKEIDKSKRYSVAEAAEVVKKTSITKFDSPVQVVFKLNLDTKQPDQQLRGTISLPHGSGKKVTVLAITNAKQEEAKEAGADFVGAADMLEKIQKENWFGFDVIVATPDMMGLLGRMGRILGPKGLMPNPKSGTVSPNIGQAIKEIKNGKITYRTDKDGNVHATVGLTSFSKEDLADNINAVIATINRVRPSSVKGAYIKNAVVHTCMGPSVKLDVLA
jgi:large subunit ribosomal protein L1